MQIIFTQVDQRDYTVQPIEIDSVAEYLFEKLKIKPADVLEADFHSHREKKEIVLRDKVDIYAILGEGFPDNYIDYQVEVIKLPQSKKK